MSLTRLSRPDSAGGKPAANQTLPGFLLLLTSTLTFSIYLLVTRMTVLDDFTKILFGGRVLYGGRPGATTPLAPSKSGSGVYH